jgi:hypothetical protein
MGRGGVSKLEYDIIPELCYKYSRGTYKMSKGISDMLAVLEYIIFLGR